jgi:hypothetical protein
MIKIIKTPDKPVAIANRYLCPMSTPNNTAVRTALWRALHLQVDASPHIIEDEIGLQLAAPEKTGNSGQICIRVSLSRPAPRSSHAQGLWKTW